MVLYDIGQENVLMSIRWYKLEQNKADGLKQMYTVIKMMWSGREVYIKWRSVEETKK